MIAADPEQRTPSPRSADDEPLSVCHVFSGDLWAGAEAVIFGLLSSLRTQGNLRLIALSLNEGLLTERLRAAGVTTHVIPESEYTLPGILRRAAKLLRGTPLTIIHSHGYKQNLLAYLLARRLGVRHTLSTLHGLPEPATNAPRAHHRMRWRARLDYVVLRVCFPSVVAVSTELKRSLVERYGFRDAQVHVIRNGGHFPSMPPVAVGTGEAFHIGTVGRLVPVKGFDLFLEVAAALRRETPLVRFSILGDGPLRDELQRKAKELEVNDCLEFVSPRPDPFPYYRSLDLYINTSWHEGLPLSVVEAMACSKPIVSAAVGGIPEIVRHGEHGLLVQGRDPAQFVESCRRLMQDERLRMAMGRAAATQAHTSLSAPAMADAYRRLYLQMRSQSPSRRESWRQRIVRHVKELGRRLIETLERRRAERARRRPARMLSRLRTARNVLVLCQGNVIRSVFAAQLLSAALKDRGTVAISSAGLATQPGWRAHPRVRERCQQLSLDLRAHASVAVTGEMIRAADVVFVMEVSQLVAVTRRFFSARPRTFLLSTLAPDVPLEILDPAGKDDATVDARLDDVARAVGPLIHVMSDRQGRPTS